MTEVDLIAKRNRSISLTYGTAGAIIVLLLCIFLVGGWFIARLISDLSDFKGVNACRAQVAEDERKATLDVTVGQGELFVTAVLNKDQVVAVTTRYNQIVQRAEQTAGRDINDVCK